MGIEPETDYDVHFAVAQATNSTEGPMATAMEGERTFYRERPVTDRRGARRIVRKTATVLTMNSSTYRFKVDAHLGKGARANELSRGTRGFRRCDWFVKFRS